MLAHEELTLKIEWYKKLKAKIEKILHGEMTIQQYDTDIHNKIEKLEKELQTMEK